MSRINDILILSLFALVISTGCKKSGKPFSGPLNALKRYPYQRFHLTYQYSGDLRGMEELFISDYGKYEARHSKFEIFGAQGIRPVDNGSISRLTDMYTIDFLLRTVIHERIHSLDSLYHLDAKDIPSPQAYMESEMKKNYFKNSGIDTIAGKPATRWQQTEGNLTLWIWNGLLLRRHASSPEGSLDMKIKEIDTLWAVDTTKFALPAGFIVTEGGNMKHAPNPN